MANRRFAFATTLLPLLLSSCAWLSSTADRPSEAELANYYPEHIGSPAPVQSVSAEELRQLNRVATNFVSVLIQIPELQPMSTSFQVAEPTTAFGSVLLSVMQDAGLALQLVSADQGQHYVSYGQRFSETDAGPVTDFQVSVNDVHLTREYVVKPTGVFPASLMSIAGTASVSDIDVADEIFKEQGGAADSFISGARSDDAASAQVSEVRVNEYDELPTDAQTPRSEVIEQSRQRYFESDTSRTPPDLDRYERARRTVLIFDNPNTMVLGRANKSAIRLLVREHDETDIVMVRACIDVDGANEVAQHRAIRVVEELVGHGMSVDSIHLAPCNRVSFRHSSDDSPVPVLLVMYRTKE